MGTISEILSEFAVNTSYEDIPSEVILAAKYNILDYAGVALAGSNQPDASQVITGFLKNMKEHQHATVIGLAIKTSCLCAAFANGFLGHYLDYDDLLSPMLGGGAPHITAVVLPAALAVGERKRISGKELLAAYIIGFEVTCRIGRGIDPAHYKAGWHTTSTEGVFGATVAASKLLGLDVEKMTYALGIAASQAAGLRGNFGTMTKALHAGQASENGVKSSLFAKLGLNSSKRIFEGESGFCRVMSKNFKLDKITEDMGKSYGILQVQLKQYPTCGATHSAIDLVLSFKNNYKIKPEEIESVTVKVSPLAFKILHFQKPKSGIEGKFSMPFCVALALRDRQILIEHFTNEMIKDPNIIEIMKKVNLKADTELVGPAQILNIRTKDGKEYKERLDFPKGHYLNPLTSHELEEKYEDCTRQVLTKEQRKKSVELIYRLETVDELSELLDILTPSLQ